MTWPRPGFTAPRRLDLPGGEHLRTLREVDVELDYPAVMGSWERLWSKYGDTWGWPPASLSFEEDRDDLARHEAEFDAGEAMTPSPRTTAAR